MPLLAAFIGSVASGLVAVFSRFVSFNLALKLASYTAWMLVFGVFLAAVFTCTASLNLGVRSAGGAVGTGWVSYFAMGLGMFIPSNAAAVMSCLASVWIACQIYKVQKQGMHHYSA